MKFLAVLSVFLYGLALLANNYFFLVNGTPVGAIIDDYLSYFLSARNGLFVGAPLLLLGIFTAKPYLEERLHTRTLVLIFTLSCAVLIAESVLVKARPSRDDRSLYASFVFLIPSMLLLLKRIQLPLSLPGRAFRQLSSGLFFTHKFLMTCVVLLDVTESHLKIFLYTLLTSIMVSCLLRLGHTKLEKLI